MISISLSQTHAHIQKHTSFPFPTRFSSSWKGADFRVAEMQVNDVTLTLQIWDTAGDKKMLSIGKSLYKNADGIILVYDISSRASFRSLDIYWDNFLKYRSIYIYNLCFKCNLLPASFLHCKLYCSSFRASTVLITGSHTIYE